MESQGSHEKSRKFSRIPILWPWELPSRISGTVAVFDVYAATTNIVSFLARGVRHLLLVNEGNLEVAKQKHPQALVIGESRQLPLDVFDYSNHPSAHVDVDLSGQSILYISDNGTRVVEQVLGRGAGTAVGAAWVNLEAVVVWLRAASDPITLVPAGQSAAGNLVAEEDLICAEAVRGLLQGKAVDGERLLGKTEAVIRSSYDRNAIADLVYVLDRDRHPVVPICFMDQEGFIRVAAASR